MGFLSKLFGYADKPSNLEEKFESPVSDADESRQAYQSSAVPKPAPAMPSGGGLPWGDKMPGEENQYSFNGTYIEYFNKVFTEDFADYDITYEAVAGRSTPATVFHFAKGGTRVLTVELMSERSDAQGTKIQCRKNGIKYLRFYYDHHGWWNARSYVTNRVRGEL